MGENGRKSPTDLKTLFEYDNYRKFLRDYYLHAKARDKKFSFRYFARQAGFQSPNFLKLVMENHRNLALPGIEKIIRALKLNPEESMYFRNLVLFNQATTLEERQEYASELMRSESYKRLHPLAESQFHYLTKWYLVPIREMVNWREFQEDPKWIGERLNPAITPAEAQRALEDLLRLGLLRRENDGGLAQTHAHLTTGDEVTAACAGQFHREMMNRAAESIDRVPREKREISSLTLGIREIDIKIVKEMVQKFRKSVLDVVAQEQGSDRIYQLSLQFFPLAASREKDRSE